MKSSGCCSCEAINKLPEHFLALCLVTLSTNSSEAHWVLFLIVEEARGRGGEVKRCLCCASLSQHRLVTPFFHRVSHNTDTFFLVRNKELKPDDVETSHALAFPTPRGTYLGVGITETF